jgi:hypothetical protein
MQLTAAFLLVWLAALPPIASETRAVAPATLALATLNARLDKDRGRHDWTAYLADAKRIAVLVNQSPDALLEVARADTHLGRTNDALALVRVVAAMGQGSAAVAALPDFRPLRKMPAFAPIAARLVANSRPVSRARVAYVLPDAGLMPEDLDRDAPRGRYLLTSAAEKKIVALDAAGRISDFARSPDGWPMLALKVDAVHGVVWATEAALDGFVFVPKRDWGRTAVLRFDLASGKLLGRTEGPRPAQFGDAALSPRGDLLLGDDNAGGLYLAPANGAPLRRLDKGEWVSPQTPAFIDARRVLIPDYARGLGRFDMATGLVRWIPMHGIALEGIDGMYLRGHDLFAIENGTAPERVVVLHLDAAFDRVLSLDTIESGTPSLDPTHGLIRGGAFEYIANAGWAKLDAHGNLTSGQHFTPARIMRAPLTSFAKDVRPT